MSVSSLSGPLFAFAALGNRAIGQLQLMHATWPMYEERIDVAHPWRGLPLRQLWENRDRLLIYSACRSKAAALLAVTSHDTANLEIALTAKSLAPNLPLVVRNQNPEFAAQVQQVFQFERVMSPTELAAPAFAAAGGRILGNGLLNNSLWAALGTLISPDHPLCGKSIAAISQAIDLVPLYIKTSRGTIHGFALLRHVLQPHVLYLTVPASQIGQIWCTDDTPKPRSPAHPLLSVAD